MSTESKKPTEPWEKRYRDTVKTQDHLAQALVAAEERFNVVFRESSDPILILDTAGSILSANAGFERYTGFTTDEWFSEKKAWPDCVQAEDLPALRKKFADCQDGRCGSLIEIRLLSAEGFYQWFELSLSPLHDEDGKPKGMVGVARNINRRKEVELQLREQAESMQKRHQRAQLLIAKLKNFFTRLSHLPSDKEGYLQGVCQVLSDMYTPLAVCIRIGDEQGLHFHAGRDQIEAANFTIPKSLRDALAESGLPIYSNTLNSSEPYRSDPDIKASDLITFLGAPLRDATGHIRGTLSIVDSEKQYYDAVDVELITVAALHLAARIRADEQEGINRELSDHLRQAQKMEAVGMLAGGIAHDFNNILSGILGFSSYLLSKVDEESTIHRDLKLIEQSAVRATDLTRQLLSFARRRHFAKQAVSLNTTAHEVLGLLRRSIDKHILIEDALDPDLPMVHGDPGQLHQVLMNLCLNASEAMAEKENGILRIATETRPLTARERRILVENSDEQFVCITVSDTGIGMSAEIQEHVFEPFYTTKANSGGTGLGLSIAYGIVTNHNGYITVDSQRGIGTMFSLYFPIYLGAIEDEIAESDQPLHGTETILIVDDEPIVRQMATQVLKDSGYQIISAESGKQAMAHLDDLRGRIDLVFLDMIMPEMDGEATFKALRRMDPELPILLTSGFVQEEKSERLINAGALGLVYKPYKSEVLLRRIRRALDSVGKRPA
jgi:PAS domain S-box-containing protein